MEKLWDWRGEAMGEISKKSGGITDGMHGFG